jgi:hypothetical protein
MPSLTHSLALAIIVTSSLGLAWFGLWSVSLKDGSSQPATEDSAGKAKQMASESLLLLLLR